MTPFSYRRAFLLDRNPIPSDEVVRLYSVQDYQRLHAIAEPEQELAEPQSSGSAAWISSVAAEDRAARLAQWNTLAAMPDSSRLFELLEQLRSTSDFANHHQYLAEQIWTVVAALEGDAQLRETIFAHMQDSQTCADGIAERFSDVQLQILLGQANRDGALHERGSRLIDLNRRLFRLERLDRFARADIAERIRSQLAAALSVVRAAQTQEALALSLSQRDFWQAYLRERHETTFDVLIAEYAA
ncbi:NEL-type E3 ubiquitin ligase domain-containing protein [Pseudomonas plecoglossicida]|uniref:NEL-type E3 ubiquitin ligase domain-containing protein n=1 Tax=Pseudomonas plecoglossicida TaxID=70775 RepID=UPI0015E274F9|nr:NEL-type E3 ubiquitin ligase domain-containing protein [Pseudomonas plecoglossicida]MBA1323730.1 hypothetical protein [Pseudomonas plecoglossicida]